MLPNSIIITNFGKICVVYLGTFLSSILFFTKYRLRLATLKIENICLNLSNFINEILKEVELLIEKNKRAYIKRLISEEREEILKKVELKLKRIRERV